MEFEIGSQRFDGKFNVWRRYSKQQHWTVVKVFSTEQAAQEYVKSHTRKEQE